MSEWKKVKLGDCIKEINEKTTKNNQYKVLSVTKDGIFSQEDFFKKQIASKNNIGYKIIRKNNLVFSTMNLWMGSLDVLTNYDIGIVSPAYKVFEFNENLMIPKYGNYFMKSYYMLEQYKNCSEQGASVVRKNLDLKALLNIGIDIPSIEEQKKIVEILNNLDKVTNNIDLLIKNIEKYKHDFLKAIFTEKLKLNCCTDKKWECDIIENICDIKTGNGNTQDKNDYGIYPFYVRSPIVEHSNKFTYNAEAVLTAGDGVGTGKVFHYANGKFYCHQRVYAMMNFKKVSAKYFYYYFSENFYKRVKKMSAKNSVDSVRKEMISKMVIKIPSVEEQKKIVNIAEKYEEKSKLLNEKNIILHQLKKALMQKLLTGKVRVKI